ncbi:MAG: PD40 domain-containing protein, partial [Bacteroidales bacterium]|nr:PD40 domain-containing protein [Bacteroidales bacterium]
MAKCYMGMCYYKPARYYFDKVVLLNPDNMANLPLYAEILRCNGQYMEALSQYYKFNNNVDDAVTSNKIFELLSFPIGNNFENPFVGIQGQYAINTFGKKRGLQFINDKLYYSTTGYMIDPLSPDYDNHINDYRIFKSDVTGNVLSNTLPENEIPVFSRNKIVSFALQPGTDALYFVALNKNGESKLYCSQLKEGGYSKKQEVRIGGESVPVESLTFDDDGNRMIFSAYIENAGGCGGNDLWYSVLKDGEWQKPVNMGSMINTRGDEITPFVYHKTLFFSSNGHQENYGGFDIYSVGLSLKKNKVCNLKMPYNSFADDFCLVINPNGDGGFLVSTRDTSILDDKIYGFSHLPNFTFCTGFVSDNNGHHLSDVGLTLYNEKTGKVEYMAKSADNGRYGVFFDNNSMYRLELEKDNYFPMKLFCKSDMDSFYLTNNSKNENIILDGFELNKAYKISDVFHQTADVEVQRTNRLSAVASFIKDNPNLVLYVHLFGYLSSDEDFNEILNKKRIENLKAFLRE